MTQPQSIEGQARLLWSDTLAWLASHTTQILLGLAAAAVIVGLLLGLKWFGQRLLKGDPEHTHWKSVIGRVLARTRLWFMLALAARLVTNYAGAPEGVRSVAGIVFVIAAVLQVALWGRELILGLIEHRAGGGEASGDLGSAMGIIRLLVTAAIFIVAGIVILDNLGVNVTGLVAGLGIGGIAIGLAAKGIFDDLFSALSILFDKPFRRGDTIQWDKGSGSVELIGLKTTRVRAITGEEVIVSNTNLLNQEIHNLARVRRRRITQTFGIIYQTPPELCARIPDICREVIEAQDKCTYVRCGMTNYGASSLDYELQFDIQSRIWADGFDIKSKALIALLERFAKDGIEFAYPTQTSFTAAPDGTLVLPYSEHGER